MLDFYMILPLNAFYIYEYIQCMQYVTWNIYIWMHYAYNRIMSNQKSTSGTKNTKKNNLVTCIGDFSRSILLVIRFSFNFIFLFSLFRYLFLHGERKQDEFRWHATTIYLVRHKRSPPRPSSSSDTPPPTFFANLGISNSNILDYGLNSVPSVLLWTDVPSSEPPRQLWWQCTICFWIQKVKQMPITEFWYSDTESDYHILSYEGVTVLMSICKYSKYCVWYIVLCSMTSPLPAPLSRRHVIVEESNRSNATKWFWCDSCGSMRQLRFFITNSMKEKSYKKPDD